MFIRRGRRRNSCSVSNDEYAAYTKPSFEDPKTPRYPAKTTAERSVVHVVGRGHRSLLAAACWLLVAGCWSFHPGNVQPLGC